jgi:Xaa-Pro dipeptidase
MAVLNLPGAFGVHMPQFRVPNSLFKDNRARLVALFSKETPEAAAGNGSVLLFKGGKQEERHETDHEPLFRQESFFAHLFGVTESGCYAVIEVRSGKATLFIPRLPAEYAVWMGPIHPPHAVQAKYDLDAVLFVDELPAWLAAHPAVAASTAAQPAIHTLFGENSDSGNSGPPLPDFAGFEALFSTYTHLRRVAVEVRVHKSAAEVAVLQKVNDIASDAHLAAMAHAKPGMVEFQLESVFRHHCYYNGGCRVAAYTSICGCGPNAATLHYGHAGAPNDRTCLEGEVMLSDQGCELRCYSCDITCSYPISSAGCFTANQRFVFDTVALCQRRVMEAMQPGVAWAAMHELAYRTLCERLVEGGLLVGSVDAMMAANVGSFFMPHGLGETF